MTKPPIVRRNVRINRSFSGGASPSPTGVIVSDRKTEVRVKPFYLGVGEETVPSDIVGRWLAAAV